MRSRYFTVGLLLLLMPMIPYFNGCNKDLSPLNIQGTSFAPIPPCAGSSSPIGMYDDYEGPFIGGSPWHDGPGVTFYSRATDSAISCTHALKLTVPAGDPGYWADYWFFYGSSLGAPSGKMSLPGATQFKIWIKINRNVDIAAVWGEGTTLGADGESWSHTMNLIGSPDWQEIVVPLDLANWTPNVSTKNHTLDTQAINNFSLSWYPGSTPYPAHILYVDDVRFVP